ncbi:ferric-dicitrate binding protein FerR (iron transport regulator) [Paenibacillus rhizosphaerae]|uniref:Ferric-dicitrate binding protein FerR (Iron transport regulator) n=1 Tax=Paenibacillus rhizosphaerae TaxID=297318 RepID=A0A839TLJ2_9BACL|nr:hypothetical protein [Paenibacillus rhizosphaerae]MBB3127714.1 ferric-dicitrate binding protein FerR (iron transport regulator) [Paenibacillus rhizosphaerae]
MSHKGRSKPVTQDWVEYIQGSCSPEKAASLESLLLEDDSALAAYMQVMNDMGPNLPGLESKQRFIDNVMDALPSDDKEAELGANENGRRRWYEHRMFHYAVAACITLIFLSAGWFDKLGPGTLQKAEPSGQPTYGEKLVNVTTGWLDRLKP